MCHRNRGYLGLRGLLCLGLCLPEDRSVPVLAKQAGCTGGTATQLRSEGGPARAGWVS